MSEISDNQKKLIARLLTKPEKFKQETKEGMRDLEKNNKHRQRIPLKEMARLLNRCEKTFRKYVVEYKIPHIRLGRDLLFNVAEVENYLKNLTMEKQNSESNETNSSGLKSKIKITLKEQKKTKNKYANLLGLS